MSQMALSQISAKTGLPSAREAMATGIWNAHLNLKLAHTKRGVRLTESDRRGPLYIQKALYPEGENLPHLYLLHPPGGLVSGDHLEVSIEVEDDAAGLLTSPGAGRLYGARPDQRPQRQDNRLYLNPDSRLEWFPMEMLLYSGANAETNTQVHLEEDSKFIGWDICALGLPTSRAPFEEGSLKQTFEIYQQGKPELIERISLDAKDQSFLNNQAGFAGMTCNALFVAGPFPNNSLAKDSELEPIKEALVEICNRNTFGFKSGLDLAPDMEQEENDRRAKGCSPDLASMMGVTRQGDWLVVRYLGESTSLAREAFVECWKTIRPILLERQACLPRIWAC